MSEIANRPAGWRTLALLLLLTLVHGCAEVEPRSVASGAASSAEPAGSPSAAELVRSLASQAGIANRFIDFALRHPDKMAWVHTQIRHARHALDPALEPEGPGDGLGLMPAARRLRDHMRLMATEAGGKPASIVRAQRIAICAENVRSWSETMVTLSENVVGDDDVKRIRASLDAMQRLARELRAGADLDKSRRIDYRARECGIAQIEAALQG